MYVLVNVVFMSSFHGVKQLEYCYYLPPPPPPPSPLDEIPDPSHMHLTCFQVIFSSHLSTSAN